MNWLTELLSTWESLNSALHSNHALLIVGALLVACAFEFINGFHDTANAVATVIYTRSLRPGIAVTWSGICNFLGVFLGGTAVAMGIVKLLPVDLLTTLDMQSSLAMVFAMLAAAITWNLGTWYFGLPASSSHTLIGSILGIGLTYSYLHSGSVVGGLNWTKVTEIGLALLISPVIGFALAGALVLLSRRLLRSPVFHKPPLLEKSPPWPIRLVLILTSSGVSLAHGSNDGQKGVGLIMLILIAILPGHFAINPSLKVGDFQKAHSQAQVLVGDFTSAVEGTAPDLVAQSDQIRLTSAAPTRTKTEISESESKHLKKALENFRQAEFQLERLKLGELLTDSERFSVRASIYRAESELSKLEKAGAAITTTPEWKRQSNLRKSLKSVTDYSPAWVIVIVALSLGLGTMIGWKRIVVTIGEKIGKHHLTYAQGASAELVAMSTIGISAIAGLPVSTTHVLSSGITGTMVAGGSGVQSKTIRNILLAWVLTLPVSMGLSGVFFWIFLRLT